MAEIRNYIFIRHVRGEPSAHLIAYRRGRVVAHGRGQSLWFLPMTTSLAEVPLDDRELTFVFHGRSSDYQDVTAQGVISYRVTEPLTLADRVDFTIDLGRGTYRQRPLETLSQMLTQLAQQLAYEYMATTSIRELLVEGQTQIRTQIASTLADDANIESLGIEVVGVRVTSVSPTSDLEKALEMPMREKIQQQADEASFARRALAVENERAIQENELQNKIELAKREQLLIDKLGHNERRRAEEKAASKRIEADAQADRSRIAANARAASMQVVDAVTIQTERERIGIYEKLPAHLMMGLAAREFAGKLEKIDHLNISPELLGPAVLNMLQAGTKKLEE